MALALEAVFEFQAVRAGPMWDLLATTHPKLIGPDTNCDFYDKRVRGNRLRSLIDKEGRPNFVITTGSATLCYGAVRNHNLSFLQVEGCIADDDDARRWLVPLLGLDAFVHARIYDYEYEFWQNADDPLQYRTRERSLEGPRTYRDELLNYEFIDTSSNPGRRVMKRGYIEALGHVMWFSPKFWALVGRMVSEVTERNISLSASKIGEADVVRFSDKPFTTPTGEEGLLQDRLRRLLFPL